MAPFGTYQSQPSAQVFSHQVIKNIKTNYPQLLFSTTAGAKEAVWIGEGIWRWRMFDYLENNAYNLTNEFINKIIQYTSVKEDKRKFRIHASKKIYADNEPIVLDAQLYNDNFELVNAVDVKVKIKDDTQKEFTYIMNKTDNFYTLYADLFPVGSYDVIAEAILNGVPLISKTTFNVERIERESLILTADHGLLRAISANSGGTFYTSDQLINLNNNLLESKDAKPILYSTEKTNALLNNKWLLGLIIILLSVEWFLRRYSGHY